MKDILLVVPLPLLFELTQDDIYRNLPLSKVKSFIFPLHLATVAALTPADFRVDIWDESVQGPIEKASGLERYTLVGLTGYTAHLPRAKDISHFFRERGIPTAIGGAGISSLPQRYYNDFDHLFIGEAEHTWPLFLAEWQAGKAKKIYRQIMPVDLSETPPPKWDSILSTKDSYLLGAVQTSRGCPFNCEFCDVSYLFGRKFRHKPIKHVLQELIALERIGIRKIVVCDDNFAGNPQYTKDLLKEIISLNRTLSQPLGFATEVSINIAQDDELLALLADANFVEIFVGIESPNKESLKEANKLQNFRSNLVEDIGKIQSYGMAVRGSLIVGFDHDDLTIFDQHFDFVQESFLTIPSIRVLMAPPGTRLWKRMRKEGRLLKAVNEGRFYGNPGTTNILPKKMNRKELLTGYLELIEKVYDWQNFSVRLKGFVSNVKRRPNVAGQFRHGKRLLQFLFFVFTRVAPKARLIILGIIWHTIKTAPYLLPRITGTIIRQHGYANRPKLREAIQLLIQQEESGTAQIEIDRDESVLPESFLSAYDELFPRIYQEVANGLVCKSDIGTTLITIFVDFLQRWGSTMESFTQKHVEELDALVHKAIILKNSASSSAIQAQSCQEEGESDMTLGPIDDRILKAVEQEMLIAGVQGATVC